MRAFVEVSHQVLSTNTDALWERRRGRERGREGEGERERERERESERTIDERRTLKKKVTWAVQDR